MDLLKSSEVGRILGVSAKTVDRWADAGMIKCLTTLGGHRRFRQEDVEEVAISMGHVEPTVRARSSAD